MVMDNKAKACNRLSIPFPSFFHGAQAFPFIMAFPYSAIYSVAVYWMATKSIRSYCARKVSVVEFKEGKEAC